MKRSQWHWARNGPVQRHLIEDGERTRSGCWAPGARNLGNQPFSLIFIEREIRAHKSKLVIPSFKTLQRIPSASWNRYKLFSLSESPCASLTSPQSSTPHGLVLTSAALSNSETKTKPHLGGSPMPGLWEVD